MMELQPQGEGRRGEASCSGGGGGGGGGEYGS